MDVLYKIWQVDLIQLWLHHCLRSCQGFSVLLKVFFKLSSHLFAIFDFLLKLFLLDSAIFRCLLAGLFHSLILLVPIIIVIRMALLPLVDYNISLIAYYAFMHVTMGAWLGFKLSSVWVLFLFSV